MAIDSFVFAAQPISNIVDHFGISTWRSHHIAAAVQILLLHRNEMVAVCSVTIDYFILDGDDTFWVNWNT